jgi:molecular chaperone GrpE
MICIWVDCVKPAKESAKDSEPQASSKSSHKETGLEKLSKEIESLKEALAEEKGRSADYLNRLKYFQADLENLQKRTRKEIEETIARANEQLISKLLVIIDDMEMAMKVSYEIENSQAIRSGFELILGKLRDLLENEGLARIEAGGKPFDHAIHEAANQTSREDAADGTIIEELRAGYTLKGKLLRPSIVIVAKNPQKSSSEGSAKKASDCD